MAIATKSKAKQPAKYGYRITVTMQAPTDEMMNWALLQGLRFAHEHWIEETEGGRKWQEVH